MTQTARQRRPPLSAQISEESGSSSSESVHISRAYVPAPTSRMPNQNRYRLQRPRKKAPTPSCPRPGSVRLPHQRPRKQEQRAIIRGQRRPRNTHGAKAGRRRQRPNGRPPGWPAASSPGSKHRRATKMTRSGGTSQPRFRPREILFVWLRDCSPSQRHGRCARIKCGPSLSKCQGAT